MIDGASISVIVPARNESRHIEGVLASMPAWVDHLIVVDDGSADATYALAAGVGDRRVRGIRHAESRGVGAAIASGYDVALRTPGGPRDAFAVMAGDGQMHPDDLLAIVGPIVSGTADYVKGDRFAHEGTEEAMPRVRYWGGRLLSLATTRLARTPVSDSQCGFTSISRELCARLPLAELWPRYGYPNDLLWHVSNVGGRISHVPVRALYGEATSQLSVVHAPQFAFVLGRMLVRRMLRVSRTPR